MKVYLILFDMMILYYIIRTNKSTHGTYNSKTKISKGKKNKKKRKEKKEKWNNTTRYKELLQKDIWQSLLKSYPVSDILCLKI